LKIAFERQSRLQALGEGTGHRLSRQFVSVKKTQKSLESWEGFKLSDDWKRFEARSTETFLLMFVEAGLGIFANKSGLPQ